VGSGGNNSTGHLPSLPAELKSRASSLPAVGEGKWGKKEEEERKGGGKGKGTCRKGEKDKL